MSFKKKIIRFLITSLPIYTSVSVACGSKVEVNKGSENKQETLPKIQLSEPEYLESINLKTPFFVNLIKLKQQQQSIITSNSVLFDQFILQLFNKRNRNEKRFNSNFKFIKDDFLRIKTEQDFYMNIVSLINNLYTYLGLNKTLTDKQIVEIFENDFLNNKNISNILKDNDIIITEQKDNWSSFGYDYILIDEDKSNIDVVYALKAEPYYINNRVSLVSTTDLRPNRHIFSAFLVPKDKEFALLKTDKEQNEKLLSALYKEADFIYINKEDNIEHLITSVSNNQSEIYKEINFLGKLTNETISDWELNQGIKIITNIDEFYQLIITPLQILAAKQNFLITPDELTTKFEKIFLNNQKIIDILKNNRLLFYTQLFSTLGDYFKTPSHILKLNENNNEKSVSLGLINASLFSYNFTINPDKSDKNQNQIKLFYNIILIPNDYKLNIKTVLSFKEANDFLVRENKTIKVIKK
ncbi:hypothetical protein [Mycoplasma sp. 4423]